MRKGKRKTPTLFTCGLSAMLAACATVDPGTGLEGVSLLVAERGGRNASIQPAVLHAAYGGVRPAPVLKKTFSLEQALQFALANSPDLQADYARLDISRADVVQASLLKNPKFDAQVGFGITGEPTRFALGVVYQVLDLVYRPVRIAEAETAFRARQVEVAERIISHGAQVQQAYVELARTQARAKILTKIVRVARSQISTARRLVATGNVDGSQIARLQNTLTEAQIERRTEEANHRAAQIRLSGFIGASPKSILHTRGNLFRMKKRLQKLNGVLTRAKRNRLDLERADQEIQIRHLALARAQRLFGPDALEKGIELDREDKETFLGPTISVELPIFDRGEGRILKAEAKLRESESRRAALERKIETDVRAAHTLMVSRHRTAIAHRDRLVPFAKAEVEIAREQFEAGTTPATVFLETELAAVRARLAAADAAAAYWAALADLSSLIGGWPTVVENN